MSQRTRRKSFNILSMFQNNKYCIYLFINVSNRLTELFFKLEKALNSLCNLLKVLHLFLFVFFCFIFVEIDRNKGSLQIVSALICY